MPITPHDLGHHDPEYRRLLDAALWRGSGAAGTDNPEAIPEGTGPLMDYMEENGINPWLRAGIAFCRAEVMWPVWVPNRDGEGGRYSLLALGDLLRPEATAVITLFGVIHHGANWADRERMLMALGTLVLALTYVPGGP